MVQNGSDNLPNQPTGDPETLLSQRLRSLAARLGNGLNDAEFIERVLLMIGVGRNARALSLDYAFMAVLERQGCPRALLAEIDRLLRSQRTTQTVKGAALQAKVDPSTLQRQWKTICAERGLKQVMRLIELVHAVQALGSEEERAHALGIDVRTLRAASIELLGRPLHETIREPAFIIIVLERWFRPDAAPLS